MIGRRGAVEPGIGPPAVVPTDPRRVVVDGDAVGPLPARRLRVDGQAVPRLRVVLSGVEPAALLRAGIRGEQGEDDESCCSHAPAPGSAVGPAGNSTRAVFSACASITCWLILRPVVTVCVMASMTLSSPSE